jgi:glyoxylase-like metal-dependent hydrolase (beta-lactamase superfamily II)
MSGNSYHFKVGNFKCLAINDGVHTYRPPSFPPPPTMLFCNAPMAKLEPVFSTYGINPNEWSAWASPYICLVINTGKQLILVDTGANGLDPETGKLIKNLGDEGIAPEDIDIVILTHAHPDHINGNTLDNGQLAFPNARYFMSKAEWDFWNSGEAEATLDEKIKDVLLSVTRQNLPPIAHKVELVEGDKVIIPGIRCIAAPGHTPGHMVLLISSEEDQLLHMVDTVLHPIHIEYPEWHSIFDYNPEEVVKSRKHLLELVVTLKAKVLAFHFPFPGLGHIVKKDGVFKWQPLSNQ